MEQDIKSVRRLGARTREGHEQEARGPRPILVVFVHRYHAEVILESCWKLSEANDPELRAVSIVKDLTLKQRAREKEIYKEVARKNLSRSQEDVEANMAYNVVGPRGSKREILAPLLVGQQISSEGDVVWDREADTGFSDRRRVRGGMRLGSAAATYPNSGQTGGGDRMGSESGYSSGTDTQSECPSPETSSAWWQYKGAWEGGRTGLWERWGTGLWEGRWNSLAGQSRREQGAPSGGCREGLAEGWERRKHEIKRPIQESTGREGTLGEQHGQPGNRPLWTATS